MVEGLEHFNLRFVKLLESMVYHNWHMLVFVLLVSDAYGEGVWVFDHFNFETLNFVIVFNLVVKKAKKRKINRLVKLRVRLVFRESFILR